MKPQMTVTLSEKTEAWVRRSAKEQGTTISAVVEDALAERMAQEREELLAEGYREMATENRLLAEEWR